MREWRPQPGDLAIRYHTHIIGLVLEEKIDKNLILVFFPEETVWVDTKSTFRWIPIRFNDV